MPPFFSVIIPTYNRANLIGKTLESLLQQQFKDFEIIVVDDGGTDNTKEVVEGFKDNRIKYYWKENAERGAARNFGASKASGKYLNFFDSDDIAYPNHLLVAKQVTKELNLPYVFHLGLEICDEDGNLVRKITKVGNKGKQVILKECYLNPNCVFLKYEVWDQIKFIEDRSLAASEDWVFFLQISQRFDWLAKDDTITSCIVEHKGRSMNTSTGDQCYARAKLIKRSINEDSVFADKLSERQINQIFAEPIQLASLHYALEKNKKMSIQTLLEAVKLNFGKLFSRRTLAILKYLLLRW